MNISDLRLNELYYCVMICVEPNLNLVVSTWIYLEKRGAEYGFCEWYEWHRAKDKSKLRLTFYKAERLRKSNQFEIRGLIQKADLIESAIADLAALKEETDNDRRSAGKKHEQ